MAPICHAFVVTFFMFLDFEQIEHLKYCQAGPGAPLVWGCGVVVVIPLGPFTIGRERISSWDTVGPQQLHRPKDAPEYCSNDHKTHLGISPHLICC